MRRWPQVLVVGCALAVTLALTSPATAATVDQETSAAIARARDAGTRLLVPGASSETRGVFANPDGTVTVEQTIDARRVKRGGAWVDVDLTLVRVADGVEPRVAPLTMRLSGGADNALSVVSDADGHGLRMTWTGTLPTPELDGRVARYRDVRPGVDLEMEATPGGFAQRFVVRTRAAQLDALNLLLEPTGANDAVSVNSLGVITITSTTGAVEGTTAPAQMWAGGGDAPRGAASAVTTRVAQSGRGAKFDLLPDPAFIADPANALPIIVDPSVNLGFDGDTYVTESTPNTAYWTDTRMKTGQAGGFNRRSFIRYDTTGLIPEAATITDAYVHLYVSYSSDCAPRTIFVKRLTQPHLPDQDSVDTPTSWWDRQQANPAGNYLTWNNQAYLGSAVWSRTLTDRGEPAGCASPNPAGFVDLRGGGDASYPDIKTLVTRWNDGDMPNYGIAVTTDMETYGAKEFKTANTSDGPALVVTYTPNATPRVPFRMFPGWSAAEYPKTNDQTPELQARYCDANGDPGNIQFSVETAVGAAVTAATIAAASCTTLLWSVPTTLTNGAAYRWRARTSDGVATSAWSPYLYFTIAPNWAIGGAPDPSFDTTDYITVPGAVDTDGLCISDYEEPNENVIGMEVAATNTVTCEQQLRRIVIDDLDPDASDPGLTRIGVPGSADAVPGADSGPWKAAYGDSWYRDPIFLRVARLKSDLAWRISNGCIGHAKARRLKWKRGSTGWTEVQYVDGQLLFAGPSNCRTSAYRDVSATFKNSSFPACSVLGETVFLKFGAKAGTNRVTGYSNPLAYRYRHSNKKWTTNSGLISCARLLFEKNFKMWRTIWW